MSYIIDRCGTDVRVLYSSRMLSKLFAPEFMEIHCATKTNGEKNECVWPVYKSNYMKRITHGCLQVVCKSFTYTKTERNIRREYCRNLLKQFKRMDISIYEGCSKSSRPLNEKIVFLQKLSFVFQHIRYLGKYIWSFTLEVSWYWQHMNLHRGPRNIHPQQQSLCHYLKISSLLLENLCPRAIIFWNWGTNNNPWVLNLVNMADGEEIRSIDHWFWHHNQRSLG